MNKNRTIFRRSILIFEDVCCFTGHRYLPADRLGEIKKRLEAESEACLRQGVILFETGGALGFDTLAAEAVLDLKAVYPFIRLILVLPCRDQTRGWAKEDVKRYQAILKRADKVVYTGMLDAFYQYRFGKLEYRSLRFESEELDMENYQGVAVVNYTDRETPFTRIIEHKHFEFGTQPKTVISREYSSEWSVGMEPYYPVNDETNQALYQQYAELTKTETNVLFGGRLAEYRYYDMDKVIASALTLCRKELGE